MKKFKLLLVSLFSSVLINAQQVQDFTETNCNNSASENLYEQLNSGKVVLIAADGFDCSICQSHAPSMGSFAAQNPNVRVWGAMHYKYSSSQPTCNNINSWKNNYSWDNIFMFIDEDRSWAGNGYPTYTVIDPTTKTIAYRGFSDTQAKNKAAELASATGITNVSPASIGLSAYYMNGQLKITAPTADAQLTLYNLEGKRIAAFTSTLGETTYAISLKTGVYVLQYANKNIVSTIKVAASL